MPHYHGRLPEWIDGASSEYYFYILIFLRSQNMSLHKKDTNMYIPKIREPSI